MKKRISFPLIIGIIFVTLAFLLTSCGLSTNAGAAVLLKGPYLIYNNDNTSMTVLWQTDSTPMVSTIQWGETEYLGHSVSTTENSSAANMHQFSYKISGLSPSKKVYYKVTVDHDSYSGSFMTAPIESATNLVFYAYGDSRDGDAEHDAVLKQMFADISSAPAERQTIFTHAGDFSLYGEEETYWNKNFFNRNYPNVLKFLANMPGIITIGNHETYFEDRSKDQYPGTLARKYFPYPNYVEKDKSYYSFDYGPVHFCVLDQYSENGSYTLEASAQFKWMKQDLSSSTKPWKIVMFHAPAWTAATTAGFAGNHPEIQEILCPVFKQYGVKVVLQGHEHFYARCNPPDGLTYLTLGGGGVRLLDPDPNGPYLTKYAKKHHFARFTIVGNTLNVEVIDENGAIIDSFTIN